MAFDYDIVFPCSRCGEKSTHYLCGKCTKEICPSCATIRAAKEKAEEELTELRAASLRPPPEQTDWGKEIKKRAEKAEAALCRAREELKRISDKMAELSAIAPNESANIHGEIEYFLQQDDPYPSCPHAAEVERLKRDIEFQEKAYLAEHENWGVCKWKVEVERLTNIPDDGSFHHRLGVTGLFGVTERMDICQLLRDHIEGKPIVDRTEDK